MADGTVPRPLAPDWTSALLKQWPRLRRRHRPLVDSLRAVALDDPQRLLRTYIEPDCQRSAPAEEQLAEVFRQPVRQWLNGFLLGDFFSQDGRHVLFVLGEEGSGKSALLLLLKLSHLAGFWPDSLAFELRKLGHDTLYELGEIEDPGGTVLLLDALDQDPLARKDMDARLEELLPRVQPFHRAVIACRPRALPPDPRQHDDTLIDEEIQVLSWRCSGIYLSPFSDDQARAYLDKRFSQSPGDRVKSWFSKTSSQDRLSAGRLLRDVPEARRHPIFLRRIDLLSRAHISQRTLPALYFAMVDRFVHDQVERRPETGRQALEAALVDLARERHQNPNPLSPEATAVDERLSALLDVPADTQGLLWRDANARWHFTEPSLVEHLVAMSIVENPRKAAPTAVRATTTLISILRDWLRLHVSSNPWKHLDLQGLQRLDIDLSGLDLRRKPLPSRLRGADLAGANLSGKDLREADLRDADLRGTDLRDTDLRGADLRGAQLDGVRMKGARLEDCRLDAQLKNGIEMVLVTPAPGDTEPSSPQRVAPFWIGRFPVTNAQYQRYLDANPEQPKPEYWTDREFNHPEQPVVGISWLEALAFCRWMGFELPTEAQWEWAARGTDGRAFPWGEAAPDGQRANFEGSGPSRPVHVNAHPEGAGPSGTLGQAGNVWEWCRDPFEDPGLSASLPTESWWPGSDETREGLYALRGGAWDSPAALLHTTFRNGQPAWFKGPNIGFRVVFQSAAEAAFPEDASSR